MINKQVNYQVNFNPNTTALKTSLQSLQKDLQSLAAMPIRLDDGSVTNAINNVKQLEHHLKTATNVNTGKLDISKFAQQLKQSNMDLKTYANSLNMLGTQGQTAFLKLAQSIAAGQGPLRRTNKLMTELWTTMKNTMRWQLTSSLLTGFTSAISTAVGYAKNLDKSLNDIRIVSGQSAASMDAFAERANKAAKALSASTLAYTDAAKIYYQQGDLGTKAIEERTEATIKMSNVTGDSAEEVSSYMTAIWNNFDKGSKSLEYFADVMAKLGAETAASTSEIATGLEKFAGIAETVGLSYEYATSALATLVAETRQSPETVGTALKTIFSRLQGLSLGETLEDGTTLNKYSEALAVVGVQIKEQDGSLKDMDKILDELGKKWNFLAEDQKMALAQTVGGVRQYTQLITLMENYDDFKINVDLAVDAEGTLDEQQKIFEDGWEASSKRVRASLEQLYSQLIDKDMFTDINNILSGLLDSVSGVIKGFGGIGNMLLPVFGMLASKLMPQLVQGSMNFVYNLKNSLGFSNAITQSMITQVEKELQKTDVIANNNSNYNAIKNNTLEILRIEQERISLQGSISSEQNEILLKKKEELALENALLEKEGKREQTLNKYFNNREAYNKKKEGKNWVFTSHEERQTMAEANRNLYDAAYFVEQLDQAGVWDGRGLGIKDIPDDQLSKSLSGAADFAKDKQSQFRKIYQQKGYGIDTTTGNILSEEDQRLLEINNNYNNLDAKKKKLQSMERKDGTVRPKKQTAHDQLQDEIQAIEDAYNDLSDSEKNRIIELRKQEKELQEVIDKNKELSKVIEEVEEVTKNDNATDEEKREALKKLETQYQKVTDAIQEQAETVKNEAETKATEAGLDPEKEQSATIDKAKEDAKASPIEGDEKEALDAINQAEEDLHLRRQERTMAYQQMLSGITNALSGMSMMIQSIQSLGSIWTNDDLSLGEKITSTVMSLSMALGAAMTMAQGFQAVQSAGLILKQTSQKMDKYELGILRIKEKLKNKELTTDEAAVKIGKILQAQEKAEAVQAKADTGTHATKGAAKIIGQLGNWGIPIAIGVAAAFGIGLAGITGAMSASSQRQQETNTKTIEKYNEDHEKTTQTLETQKSFNELYRKFEETGEGAQELAKEARNTAKELGISGAEAKILAGNFKDLNAAITDKTIETLKEDQEQNETAQAAAQSNLLAVARKGKGHLYAGDYYLSAWQGAVNEKVDKEIFNMVANGDYKFLEARQDNRGDHYIKAAVSPEDLVALYDEISKFIAEVQNSDIEDYNASEYYKYYSEWIGKEGLAEAVETLRGLQNTEKEQELSFDLLTTKKNNEDIENYEDYLKFYEKMQNAQKDAKYSTEELNAALMVDLDTSKWESVRQGIEDLTKETGIAKQKWEKLYNIYGNAIFTAKIEAWMDDEQLEKEVKRAQNILNSKEITVQLNAVYSSADSFIKARQSGDNEELEKWFAENNITTDAEKIKLLNMTDEEFENYWIKGSELDFQKNAAGKTVGTEEVYNELNNLETAYNEQQGYYDEFEKRDKDIQFLDQVMNIVTVAKSGSEGKTYEGQFADDVLKNAIETYIGSERIEQIKKDMGYENFGEKEFQEYVTKLFNAYYVAEGAEPASTSTVTGLYFQNFDNWMSSESVGKKKNQYKEQLEAQGEITGEAHDSYIIGLENANVYNSEDLYGMMAVANRSTTISELLQNFGSVGRDTKFFWEKLNELVGDSENTLATVQEYQREYQKVLEDTSLDEEERIKKLKTLERQYDSILIAEEKIAEIRSGAEDILSALEADERGEEELTSSEKRALYAQLAKAVNDAYDTSYTGQDIETNPALLKTIKNIVWGVDSVKEYTQSLLQIWSNPDVLNVKLDLEDQEKAEKLAVLMGKIDDVDNEIKLKEVFIEMAKLLEKDFSKLMELLAKLMGIEISDETLAALGKFGSLISDGKINLDTELNGTDEEGSSIFSPEDKEGYLGWLKDQGLVTDDDVSYDEKNDKIKIEGSNADGSITAVLEDLSNYLGYLLGDAALGKMMSFLLGGSSISNNEAITKDNIAEKAKLPDDPAQYDDLADKLKKAKNLYPELTKAYNKYIDALRKGTATQDDYLDFVEAITDTEQIDDYKEHIEDAADAYEVLMDKKSSARQKADAYEDISDSLDSIFNTELMTGDFVKDNLGLVMDFLENGIESPNFDTFLNKYYEFLDKLEEINLKDTTFISEKGDAIDIPLDITFSGEGLQKLKEEFGGLMGLANQMQAAFDQLQGPEPSTEGLTALIGSLITCCVSAEAAAGMVMAFAASVPGTLTTQYIIDIVQRFSIQGDPFGIQRTLDYVQMGSTSFSSREEAKQFLKDNGLGDLDAEVMLQTYGSESKEDGVFILSGYDQAKDYQFGKAPYTPPPDTPKLPWDFKGNNFQVATEETDALPPSTGGSPSKEEPQEPEKKVKKYNAELEKTKAILENLSKEYEKLEKLSDSYLATDEDRLVNLIGLNNNLNKQLDLYNDMKIQADDALPDTKTEMLKWLKEAKFSEADLQYDQEGRIINLPELIQKMDHKIADAGSGDEQSELEEAKGLMEEGIENYNEIVEALVDAEMGILDTSIEISKNNLEQITLPFEIFSRRTEQERKNVETYLGWLEDVNGKSVDRLNYRSKTSLSLLEEYGANEDKINTLLATGLTTQAQRDALEEALNHKLELRTSLLEEQKAIIEEVGNYLEEHNEYIDRFYDTFDRINSLLDTYKSVMEVIGKNVEEHQAINLKISDTQIKNSQIQLRAAKATKEAAQATYDAVKKAYDNAVATGDATLISHWEEQLWSAEDRLNEAADNFQSAWTDSLDLILERYELAVEQTILRFEDSLSPQKTLDEKNKLYENLLEESDRFLTNEERVYELNKINRQINQEMSKNPNILVQQKLLGIQELINKLKKDEANITDYQLSKLQKIYDLRLAEIALEEAQNNKTQARLVRNSQGNWNYVFTADQGQIDQAAQQLEDARYNYYKNAKEQADKLSKEILDNEKNLSEALKNIKREDYTSEEEYRKALDDKAKYYLNWDAYLRAQMDEALYDSSQSYADSVLGQIEGYESLDAAHQNLETATETAINEMVSHFATFEEEVKNTMTEAGEDYDTFVDKLDTSLDSITSWSETASTNVSNACKTMVDSFQTVIDKAIEFAKAVNLDGMTTEGFNEMIKTDSNSAFDKTYNTPSGHANTDYTGLALKLYETYGEEAEKLIKIVNQMRNQKISSGLYDTKDATYMSEEEFLNYVKSNSTVGSNTLGKKIELNLSEEVDNDIQKALDNLIKNSEYFDAVTYSGGTASSGTGESGANTAAGLSASTEYSNIVLVSTGEEVTEDEFYEHLSSPKMQAAFKLNGIQVAFHRGEDGNIYGTYAGQTKTLDVIKGMTEFATAFNPFLGKDVYEALANAQGIVNPAEFYSEEQILRLITGENAGKHIKLQQPNKNLRVALTMNTSDNTIQAYNPDKAGDNKWEFWRDLRGDFGYIDPWQGEGNEDWWKALGIKSFDTGGYTGNWNSSEGRMAMLHEKELILNKADTKNLLSAVEVLRGMSSSIAGMLLGNAGHQMNGLAKAISVATVGAQDRTLQQQVHIDATFPGVTSAFEIETALNNIINDVSQYAEIKKF